MCSKYQITEADKKLVQVNEILLAQVSEKALVASENQKLSEQFNTQQSTIKELEDKIKGLENLNSSNSIF